jgi:hypothetical protein
VIYRNHIVNQMRATPPLVTSNTLHIIGVISNYARFQSRYGLFRAWYEEIQKTTNAKVYIVEAAFGDRDFEVTSAQEPTHLQVRTNSEIWIKENLVNLGVRHLLPRDWKYVAWIDCDVEFRDPNWAGEAMQQAQHHPLLQPWQSCADLGPTGQITTNFSSFGFLQQTGVTMQTSPEQPYKYGHSGFAWVATRAMYEAASGLLDFAILGSADHHMAWASLGSVVESSVHAGMSDDFKQRCTEWQNRVVPMTHKQVGYSAGRLEHSFHGPKKRRYYRERWQILVDNKFQPSKDLRYDDQGVLQLVGKPNLEAAIRAYNRSRAEDDICE